jgi:hypothetical protein
MLDTYPPYYIGLYNELNSKFTTGEAIQAAQKFNIGERSVNRFLKNRFLFSRMKYGSYIKQPKEAINSDTISQVKSIYVIGIVGTDLYKIGIASDVNARMSQLQVGNPFELYKLFSFQTDTPGEKEKRLHKILKPFKVRGEWFEVKQDKLRFILMGFLEFDDFLL